MNFKEYNGLILVDKPVGKTSHDVVGSLRRILGTRAVGHTGTLDPLASGLMVCLVNEGTKLSQYILEGDKGYRVTLQFGFETDTLDVTGSVLKKQEYQVSREQVLSAALALQGEFSFEVPIYSAIKVQGQKLYEYARNNEEVKIPLKLMKFWDVKMLEFTGSSASFDICCSKGSYIRTWVQQLGRGLGCGATMSDLRRTWSAPYFGEAGMTLEAIKLTVESNTAELTANLGRSEELGPAFVSMELALPQLKIVRTKGQEEAHLRNGLISHELRAHLIAQFDPDVDESIQVFSLTTDKLIAIVGVDPSKGFVVKRGFKH